MSYDIELVNKNGQPFPLTEPIQEGGTQQLGGNTETWLNVTYNYSQFYYHFFDKEKGIRWLYGKKAKDCKERLTTIVKEFENFTPYDRDYWADGIGNCVKPLRIFLNWCEQFPEGTFRGD